MFGFLFVFICMYVCLFGGGGGVFVVCGGGGDGFCFVAVFNMNHLGDL